MFHDLLSFPLALTIVVVSLIENHRKQKPIAYGVSDGAHIPHWTIFLVTGDPNFWEPIHEGLATVSVEHSRHDAEKSVVVRPESKTQHCTILLY